MAVAGSVGCGGSVSLQRRPHEFRNTQAAARACSSIACSPAQSTSKPNKILSSSKVSLKPLTKQEQDKKKLTYEKIDEWMRDSVVEIVKKLPESPLLVHVYSDNDTTKTRTEKAAEENWVSVKRRWERGDAPMPDGVIFVEQIQGEGEEEEEEGKKEEVSRAWGIVVQGKGEECGPPACYLLKTSKVGSGSGLGLRCTHFCLVKVSSFRETAFSQLKNCWLLQGT